MAEETTEQQSTWLTHDAFDRLTEELRRRKDTDRKEIAARVEAARQIDHVSALRPGAVQRGAENDVLTGLRQQAGLAAGDRGAARGHRGS